MDNQKYITFTVVMRHDTASEGIKLHNFLAEKLPNATQKTAGNWIVAYVRHDLIGSRMDTNTLIDEVEAEEKLESILDSLDRPYVIFEDDDYQHTVNEQQINKARIITPLTMFLSIYRCKQLSKSLYRTCRTHKDGIAVCEVTSFVVPVLATLLRTEFGI